MAKNTAKEINRKKQWAKDNPDKRNAQSKRAYDRTKDAARQVIVSAISDMQRHLVIVNMRLDALAPYWPGRARQIKAHLEKTEHIFQGLLAPTYKKIPRSQNNSESHPENASDSHRCPQNENHEFKDVHSKNFEDSKTSTERNLAIQRRTQETNQSRQNSHHDELSPRTAGNYDPIKYLIAKFPQFAEQPEIVPQTPEPPPNNDIILGVMKQYNLEGNFAEQYNAAIEMIKKYPALTKIKYEKTVAS
jgi:hypothetical protein